MHKRETNQLPLGIFPGHLLLQLARCHLRSHGMPVITRKFKFYKRIVVIEVGGNLQLRYQKNNKINPEQRFVLNSFCG